MTPADAVLKAYDVLDSALAAGTVEEAVGPVRADLEVLDRDDLLRVATALAVESTVRLTPRTDRPLLRERIGRARIATMWAGS